MNLVLPMLRLARISPDTASGLSSKPMRTELLALHEGMIAQLRLECREGAGDFLPRMIEQHERAAAELRAQLQDLDDQMPM